MKISIFTTVTNPVERGDNHLDALRCYKDLADDVVVVNGGDTVSLDFNLEPRVDVINKWPEEFDWPFIGQQFQRGYEACTGDWVIHADLDFIFHEKDFEAIRNACEANPDAPALSLWKFQFILPDRYNLKSRLVVAVNKGKYGDRIRFDSGKDLCQPSLDGVELKPDNVPEARVSFYNYEKILKTKEQVMADQGRMERAYMRHFKRYQMSADGSDQDSYDCWLRMQLGRFNKPQKHISLSDHPIYMQETIKNLQPEQFGYSAHGNLANDYFR